MKLKALFQIFLIVSATLIFGVPAVAQESQVCCEETNGGDFCVYTSQDTQENSCKPGALQAPTSCSYTSFCKPGTCIDLDSGFCYPNMGEAQCVGAFTNKKFVSENNLDNIAECKLGCCVIGTQAQMLTKNRCKSEAEGYGLTLDFREDITDEQVCIDLSRSSAKGCCVTEDGKATYTTKNNCDVPTIPNEQGFYEEKFCSQLPFTDCTSGKDLNPPRTGCLPTEDHVFYFDSCGNREEVASPCNYLDGSLCGDLEGDGTYECEKIDCSDQDVTKLSLYKNDYLGTPQVEMISAKVRHGESWCIYDVEAQDDDTTGGQDPPGSRYYRSVCISGKEYTEPCADFRKEWCMDGTADLETGEIHKGVKSGSTCNTEDCFTSARCIENRGQSCIDQCNTADPFTMDAQEYKEALENDYACCTDVSKRDCTFWGNKCSPKVPLGFKFWSDDGANTCAKASMSCKAVFRCGGWINLFGACEYDSAKSALIPTGLAGLGAFAIATGGTGAVAAAVVLSMAAVYASSSGAVSTGGLLQWESAGDGWNVVKKSSACLTQDFLQAGNNYCRSFGDCGADYNYLSTKLGKQHWGLTYAGFDNTKSINSEITMAVIGRLSDDDKLAGYKISKEKLATNVDENFEFSELLESDLEYRIPGRLQGTPSWEDGTNFIDMTLRTPEIAGGFERFFFNRDGEPSWFVSHASFQVLLTGLTFATMAYGGATPGAAFGATPLGAMFATPYKYLKSTFSSKSTTLAPKKPAGSAGGTAPGSGGEVLADGSSIAGEALSTAAWIYMIYQVGDILLEEVKEEEIKTTCKPWQAPLVTQEDQCEKCNPNHPDNENKIGEFQKCSEYRCKSLGTTCELVNSGTEEEKCVSVNQDDVTPPIIKDFREGMSQQIITNNYISNSDGMRINGVLPIYQRMTISLETDEPAQCKMSTKHSTDFETMDNTYFGSNSYKYFHSQNIVFPQSMNKSLDEVFTVTGEGKYQFFVKCQDARGNANERDYAIEFDVDKSPDLTAPRIEYASFGTENNESTDAYLTAGTTTIPQTVLFINEPGKCLWSTMDEPFNAMAQQENNVCTAQDQNALGLYSCTYQEAGVPNSGGPITITELKPGETKFIYFKCKDDETTPNFNKDPFRLTLHGSEVLNITSIEPEGELLSQTGAQNVTLLLSTKGGAKLNGESECRYSVDNEMDINGMVPFLNTNSHTHSNIFTTLSSGEHTFYTACHDLAGNVAEAQTTIQLSADSGVPQIIRAYKDTTTQPPLFTIEANELSECRVSTDGPFAIFEEGNLMVKEGDKHQIGFTARVYWVRCMDGFGNINEVPTRISFLE